MRQLATMPSADAAHALADYLLTLKIDTRLEQQPDGWAIWICDEDHLPRARQELQVFTDNPSDPRFQDAARAANALRREKQQTEKAYQQRQKRFSARMGNADAPGPWSLALIIACIVVMLVKDATSFGPSLTQSLFIASTHPILVQEIDPVTGHIHFQVEESRPSLQPILHGQIWRVITPIFLHFGIWHLFFNLSWLYVLGGAIERRRGPLRYVTLVLTLAVLSNLTQYFLGHPVRVASGVQFFPTAHFGGMSGVVYGLFGYVWMKARFQPELGLTISANSILIMMAWFFLCFTPWIKYVIPSGVANAAHAGGLIAGVLIGYLPTTWR